MSEWTKVEANSDEQSLRWTEKAENPWQEENTIFLGKTIKGIYTRNRVNIGENNATVYTIKIKDKSYSVWSTTVLQDRMLEVPVGSEVEINYLGKQKPKGTGKPYATFSIRYRDTPMTEVNKEDIPF